MRWFANLSTGKKLAVGFSLNAALLLLLGVLALGRMTSLEGITQKIVADPLSGTSALARGWDALKQIRLLHLEAASALSDDDRGKIVSKANDLGSQVDRSIAAYEQTAIEKTDKEAFARLRRAWNSIRSRMLFARSSPSAREFRSRPGSTEEKSLVSGIQRVDSVFAEMVASNSRRGALLAKTADGVYQSGRITVVAIMLVALLLVIVSSTVITALITRPLSRVTAAAKGLAEGDVAQEIALVSCDEVGQLSAAFRSLIAYQTEMARSAKLIATGDLRFNVLPKSDRDVLGTAFAEMVANLRRLIGDVAKSAQEVASTSDSLSHSALNGRQLAGEIGRSIQDVASAASQSAATSQDMARGSEELARMVNNATQAVERLVLAVDRVREGGSREKIAAGKADQGMESATAAVEEVARSAQQMARTAEEAAAVAQGGGEAVLQTIQSMGRIEKQVDASSEKVRQLGAQGEQIGTIIETIDQIAEQTNLLALNAAIEAARAGEHGRGFAVVADEVRKLAERCAAATKDIAALIRSVQSTVEQAVDAMEESGREVAAGAQRSEEAGRALREIVTKAEAVASEVQSVSAIAQEMAAAVAEVREAVRTVSAVADQNELATDEMASGAELVAEAIMGAASISEESAASAEQMSASAQEVSANAQSVTAAIEEQAGSIDQISSAALRLSQMSGMLQELVHRFHLDEERADHDRPTLRLDRAPGTHAA